VQIVDSSSSFIFIIMSQTLTVGF